ncbi:hypothetical protein BpHYR1_009766 [Brachionus plicatilis]|uniref:Uncharacterized protein n=1 Tax=Brachionus plicatilis TaxID=10195 RepID=A0A3M7T9S9_BRAPC|nr:hypothetical protein BpHYR1_009766 [Brachionus plicatilis]
MSKKSSLKSSNIKRKNKADLNTFSLNKSRYSIFSNTNRNLRQESNNHLKKNIRFSDMPQRFDNYLTNNLIVHSKKLTKSTFKSRNDFLLENTYNFFIDSNQERKYFLKA